MVSNVAVHHSIATLTDLSHNLVSALIRRVQVESGHSATQQHRTPAALPC
jgi:hypothetical protein